MCLYGFIGLAIDIFAKNKLFYPGWYWYLYPLITVFWIVVIFLIFLLSLTGIKFPDFKSKKKLDLRKFREEVKESSLKEICKGFEKEIEQLEQLAQKGELKLEQANVVKKLRTFDRSKYDRKMKDLFEYEEIEELLILLLIIMGMESE
jgi:hypothetical protein